MSRIIVKNLPKNIKEEKFRSLFASKGEITDLRLCKTKDGVFRRFGFVGFKTEEQAENAMKFFNNSYIDTSKIQIEIARNLGEESSTRPWSKYSRGSSAYEKRVATKRKELKTSEKDSKTDGKTDKRKDKETKSKDLMKELDEIEQDPEFQEFLAAHQNRTTKSLWSNDTSEKTSATIDSHSTQVNTNKSSKNRKTSDAASEDEENEDENNDDTSDHSDSDQEDVNKTSASATNLSDMDYLKTKVVSGSKDKKPSDAPDEEEMDSDDNSNNDESSDDNDSSDEKSDGQTSIPSKPKTQEKQNSHSSWTLKMRGLPFRLKEKQVMEFFLPIECVEVRFVNNKKGQRSGRAFVDFKSEEDLEKALKRDKDYLQGRYIELFRDYSSNSRHNLSQEEEHEKPWMKKLKEERDNGEEDESIGESGRLFLRNLSYTCTEDDVQKLFEKHGPLSEVNLPLDKQTNKTIGIGYVTFLMPEHAVKAFNELDGKVFQGRLLHILPSKAKKTEIELAETTYKKIKEAKKKSQSSSDHNWNTLFLGVNAVADAMADKYNMTKRGILDAESSNSLAVRMALGETQVVANTRKFLIEHGVKLDVFGQPTSNRSKTVMIAKNLPYGTKREELTTLFSPFGQHGRLVLPPSGITALVEFPEPSAARKAFQKLAYTKFKNSLLYLEWAPVDVFVESIETLKTSEDKELKNVDQDEETKQEDLADDENESEDSEGKTLFVKNLNFETIEETLKEKFLSAGAIRSVTIARKKDSKNQGTLLSMGYGFVEFKKKSSALKAMKELQNCIVDGHALELKISHRKSSDKVAKRQRNSTSKQKSSKLLVRNVPFEATTKELRELFSTFGEIKTLRLPKKMTGTSPHRGFAFVDFLTKQDAKRAFESLSTSTHLYGRRLVLEWAQDEDDVETLRKRTAEHFHGEPKNSKKKQALVNELLEMEDNA